MRERMSLLNRRELIAKIAENWPAKVLSIALAIVIFIFHRMSLLEERFFSVPLSIQTHNRLVPSGSYPRMIRVTLRGDANTIYPILEEDIHAYIDLSKYTEPGTYRAPVQIRKQNTALQTEALEISVDPLELVLTLDERLSKTVPVAVKFRGAPEQGYELSSYTLDPTRVVIEGPKGLLGSVSELATDTIDLTGRSNDFTTAVRIINQEPLLVIRGNGFTEFRGIVREQLRVQNFEDIPLNIINLNNQFAGEPEIIAGSVRIEGGQNIFETIVSQEILLTVDCAEIDAEGSYLLPVLAVIPQLVTLVRQDPENVIIHIRRKQGQDSGKTE
jgi:YbbR domain-containing protein